MNLLLVGTNHRIASVAVRERLAASAGGAAQWLAAIGRGTPAIAEVLVVATCHRVELYAATDDLVAAEAAMLALTSREQGCVFATDTPRYVRAGEDAVRHLCRVACGLDSVIVGEAEISGQVRRAAGLAREAGTLGPYLERLTAAALRSSGRARAETQIGRGVLSAASAGVTLATMSMGAVASTSFLVVGAGQMGKQVLARLARLETGPLFVASRSDKHAREAAAESGATVVALEAVIPTLAQVDVLLTTLQTPSFVVGAADVPDRSPRPLFIVDLSVPRAVDPAVGAMAGVTLRTVDDLGDIARASLHRRVLEIPRVEAIAHDEASRAFRQFRARAARASRRD